MRKLIAVGMLVGGLLAGAGPAMAANPPLAGQGGIGDPLTLASSGVLIPFITGAGALGEVALIEVASPVGPNLVGFPSNPNLHMLFYNTICSRVGDSAFAPETVNEIEFVSPTGIACPNIDCPQPPFVPAGTSGLVAIAGLDPTGFFLVPLFNPIHTRVYQFNPTNGRSRIFEPIIIDTAEFGYTPTFAPTPNLSNGIPVVGGYVGGYTGHFWSPLRTAATFFAPLWTATVHTELTLVCPRTTIQGVTGAAFGTTGGTFPVGFSSTGFPLIDPPFKAVPVASPSDMQGIVYDDDEQPLTDVHFSCDCLTADKPVFFDAVTFPTGISPIYANAALAPFGTYTEIEVTPIPSPQTGSFTGYKNIFSVGSPLNSFWGRLSNGNRQSIDGGLIGGINSQR